MSKAWLVQNTNHQINKQVTVIPVMSVHRTNYIYAKYLLKLNIVNAINQIMGGGMFFFQKKDIEIPNLMKKHILFRQIIIKKILTPDFPYTFEWSLLRIKHLWKTAVFRLQCIIVNITWIVLLFNIQGQMVFFGSILGLLRNSKGYKFEQKKHTPITVFPS